MSERESCRLICWISVRDRTYFIAGSTETNTTSADSFCIFVDVRAFSRHYSNGNFNRERTLITRFQNYLASYEKGEGGTLQSRNEEKELLSRRHDKAILLALDTRVAALFGILPSS